MMERSEEDIVVAWKFRRPCAYVNVLAPLSCPAFLSGTLESKNRDSLMGQLVVLSRLMVNITTL